jgi:deoxyribodipyrimidine photo-lyase
MTDETVALWWIRRDLRLHDNQALAEALHRARSVVPVFVLDPQLLDSPGQSQRRIQFLLASLARLDDDLRARGSRLVVRTGDPADVLAQLVRDLGARWVVAEADYTPYARHRDARVARRVPLQLCPGLALRRPEELRSPAGRPYTVFTTFARAWWRLPAIRPHEVIPAPPRLPPVGDLGGIRLDPPPTGAATASFPPGEAAAQARLAAFCQGDDPPIFRYASARHRLDGSGSSRLSPYLRFGQLSARVVWCRALEALERAPDETARAGVRAWLNELLWRDFWLTLLSAFPRARTQSLRPEYRDIEWDDDETLISAWRAGRTGYPTVDAAMRQLASEGWISNRARMLVASFLTKDLLTDWRIGERWFLQQLIDGDPALNSGNWQWCAGTGTDAVPYFRIFNPVAQGERYDPGGRWTRSWVPELRGIPDEFVHRPWTMPPAVQQRCGLRLGHDYPLPIVDHAVARARAIARYRAARSGYRGRIVKEDGCAEGRADPPGSE